MNQKSKKVKIQTQRRIKPCLILILAGVNFSCAPASFSPIAAAPAQQGASSSSGTIPGEGDVGVCAETVAPTSCPLDGTFECAASDNCGPSRISRYHALIESYQFRGAALCVLDHNHFPSDAGCTGAATDNPSLCHPYLGGVNARDCIDAAATNPFITTGISSTFFGQQAITKDQALTFAYRATIGSLCESSSLAFLAVNNPAGRQAWINNSNALWQYIFIAAALKVISPTEGATASNASVSVSDTLFMSYLNGFSAVLAGAATTNGDKCAAINLAIENAAY